MDKHRPIPFYAGSLNATTYDLGIGRAGRDTDEDIIFYRDLARDAGRRVLELASGTGRVSIRLALDRYDVVGLERSAGMLQEAKRKHGALPPDIGDRLRFVEGDMTTFDLRRAFDLVIIPHRSFAFLLEPEDQRACLERVLAHLRPGGTFAFQVFDPRLDLCVPGVDGTRTDSGVDPETGHTIRVDVLARCNDPVRQILRETWRFTEIDRTGEVLRAETEELVLRWTYRYEMRYLLQSVGFEVIAEYSDFAMAPPAYGLEQVWVARRPDA